MQEAVVEAAGEDRFVVMVTYSAELFALRETYSTPCGRPLGPQTTRQRVILDASPTAEDASR